MKRVLLLEPYYGGSHRFFLEGLQRHVAAQYVLYTMPARKWKMRMQLSALWAFEKIKALPLRNRRFDAVLCSSFIDVAVLRALLARVDGWDNSTRICTYFHENQFHYPERKIDSHNFHFAAINFHSAVASDAIAFNSAFNADTFHSGCQKYLRASSEMELSEITAQLRQKSFILHPGIDFTTIDRQKRVVDSGPPVIVWNHRWEHDKNPDFFFQVIKELYVSGVDFRLILLGKSYAGSPSCFADSKLVFRNRIIQFGYTPSYESYASLLCRGNIVVSTALHEFFGIAVIEAVRAGCFPLLPDRLAYPEIFTGTFLYRDGELRDKLARALRENVRLDTETMMAITEKYRWDRLAVSYEKWLFPKED